MYLYKAACSEITFPRQRNMRTPGRLFQRQGAGLDLHPTTGFLHGTGTSGYVLEPQKLDALVRTHGCSVQETVGPNTKMIYRYMLIENVAYVFAGSLQVTHSA